MALRMLPLLLDEEVQHKEAYHCEPAEEYTQQRDVGPPERVRPQAERAQDRSGRDVQVHSVLQTLISD